MSDPTVPQDPYGQQPPAYGQQPPAYGQQPPAYGQQPPAYGQPYANEPMLPDPDADKRPGTVTAACILALLLSGLTAVLSVIGVIALVADRDDIIDDLQQEQDLGDSVTADQIFTGLLVVLAVVVIWCLIAMLLAILTLRRSNVARILLIISSVVTALLSLLLILSAVSAITLICGVSVMVMLLGRGARDWSTRKNAPVAGLPQGTTQPWG